LVKKGDLDSDVIEHLQLIFIELPKFPVHSPDEKRLRLLWLRFLREIDPKTKTVSQELLDVPEIAEAVQLAEEAAYTPGELAVYEGYWDQIRREKTLMIDKFAEGKAQGRAEGFAEGEVSGIEKIVINMLKNQEPFDKISKFTGLSLDEIAKLKNKIE
jgi:predicted transposase/invertase (TIGR01784 family)